MKLAKLSLISLVLSVWVAGSFMVLPVAAATSPVTTRVLPVAKTVVAKKPVKKIAAKLAPAPVKPVVKPAPAPAAAPLYPSYMKAVFNEKPIILSGDEKLEIVNTYFIQNQNIILKDRAELIIRNSFLEQRSVAASPVHYLEAKDFSQVKIINSDVRAEPGIVWKITDHANLVLQNATLPAGTLAGWGIWHEVTKEAAVSVRYSPFHGSLTDRVNVTISNSPDVYLDLDLNGAIVDKDFGTKITDFTLPESSDHNLGFKLKITDSVASGWGIKAYPTSNLTVRNGDNINLSLLFNKPLEDAEIILDGLQITKFEDRTFGFRQMKVRLVNSAVATWIPTVGEANQLTIKNSNVTEQRWSWGGAKVTLENTNATLVRARDNVEIVVKNSTVTGDIIAEGNGKVTIINSTVPGQRIIRDNGRISEK